MKLSNVLTGMSFVAALAGAPAAHAAVSPAQAPAKAQVDDDAIESRIEKAIKKDSILAARGIDVESDQGKVTLTGKVKDASEKARAARLAKGEGVVSVVNSIEIDPNADRSKVDRAAEGTKEGLDKAVDATAKGVKKGVDESAKAVGKAADKTADAVDTAGDKVSDASVTASVKTRIASDPMLKATTINVDTAAHVVTLRGTVATTAAKAKAEEIAMRTDGVKRVVNELVVKP